MKKQFSFLIWLFMLIAGTGMTSGCPGSVSVGGGCTYKDYDGVITIIDIRPETGEYLAPQNPEENLYVSYKFRAVAGDAPSTVRNLSEETMLTRREIENKEIKIGRQFRGKAKYIASGSCNPGPYLDKFEHWQ